MPPSRVEAAGKKLKYPPLLRLALNGGWISNDQAGKVGSTVKLLETLKASLPQNRWLELEQAVLDIAAALPMLSLAKIERYCEAFNVKGVDLNTTKAAAAVDLYLGKPEKFPEIIRLCESYPLGAREIYTAKKTYQSRLQDFNLQQVARDLEEGLGQLDRPIFRGREILVQLEKRKSYWEALVYYEQRPRQFRVFKQKRQVSSLVVRPVALLHLACAAGQRLEVKGRSKSAVAAALPVLSKVLTGVENAFEPDTVLFDVSKIAGQKLKIAESAGQPSRNCKVSMTSIFCREVGLPGSPTIRVSIALPKATGGKKKAQSPAGFIEDVAAKLKEWTGGKLDLLRTELIEADFAILDATTGESITRFKYYRDSPKRGLPVDPERRRIAEECLAKLRR